MMMAPTMRSSTYPTTKAIILIHVTTPSHCTYNATNYQQYVCFNVQAVSQ